MSPEYPNESGPERAWRLWKSYHKPRALTAAEEAQVWKFNHPGEKHLKAQSPVKPPDPQFEVVIHVPTNTLTETKTPFPSPLTVEGEISRDINKTVTGFIRQFAEFEELTGSNHEFRQPTIPLRFLDQVKKMQKMRKIPHIDPYTLRIIPILLDDLTGLDGDDLNKFVDLFRKFSDRRNRKSPLIRGEIDAAMDMFTLALKNSSLDQGDLAEFRNYYDVGDLAEVWVFTFDAAGRGLLLSTITKNTDPKDRELLENNKTVESAYVEFLKK